jgi:hypothetical protein
MREDDGVDEDDDNDDDDSEFEGGRRGQPRSNAAYERWHIYI